MRKLEYLSPTAIAAYLEDKDNFYMDRLAEVRRPRSSQTQPMSIGSAFDAYAKSYLFEKLIGKNDPEWPKFEFTTLFEKQVEPQHRTWAKHHGNYVFQEYVKSGALADMITELSSSLDRPRFEFDLLGTVQTKIGNGVPLLGKPDIFFVNSEGLPIISDWKVNGYCSRGNVSPKKGYIKIFPSYDTHHEAYPQKYKGTTINANKHLKLQDIDESWARQTIIYSWLCGCPVGSVFVHSIDQVVCNNRYNTSPGVNFPELRFAQHRYLSDPGYQLTLFQTIQTIWNNIQTPETYYSDMTPEESATRCAMLELRCKNLYSGQSDELFDSICLD